VGTALPVQEVEIASFGSGAGFDAPGFLRIVIISGASSFGSGGGLAALGAGARRGTANLGAGGGLSAQGVVTTRPSPVIVTASATLTMVVSASAIIEGIVSATILTGELEVEE
jgi:hypothetical protein